MVQMVYLPDVHVKGRNSADRCLLLIIALVNASRQ